jgi:DNA repair exonuclease SbcCD ATPase subunit
MNRIVRKEFVLAVGSCLIAVLIAGCEEQNLSTAKKGKLAVYENRQLKEQLTQREKKIEEQNRLLEECQQRREILEKKFEEEQSAQWEKKIEEQNKLLMECQQRREILEKKFEEEVSASINELVEIFRQSDEELHQENNKLRVQVEELQAEVSKLEQELKDIKSPEAPEPLTP